MLESWQQETYIFVDEDLQPSTEVSQKDPGLKSTLSK